MFKLFVIGNIASGKSSATRYLESRGAYRIDLDALAKSMYLPQSALLDEIALVFGSDVLDADGSLVASRLADKAFSSAESIRKLDGIVYPHLLELLSCRLQSLSSSPHVGAGLSLVVVEVSNALDFSDGLDLADEVLAISTPLEVRKNRALGRGMSSADFDARAAVQPPEEELGARADAVISNGGDETALYEMLDSWLACHGFDPASLGGL